MTETRLRYRY